LREFTKNAKAVVHNDVKYALLRERYANTSLKIIIHKGEP
jgi:hypothetical protein